ncbi:MAG: CGNR zinc finger domain-containing protein [Mycobacterium sp.]|uniref:CGNR zinc finger domain-containing protein n=1 Tax=Mycobacterium sp. TaxID=1785 RepID=UPI003F9AF189
MDYGSYTDASVRLMVELANSYDPRQDPPERLPDTVAVTGFLRRHRMLGPNTVRQRDVTDLRQLRARIRRVFEASDEAAAIAELNGLLADAVVTPWIARTAVGREIFFAPQDAPLARRVACDAGLGLAMMMTDYADRLKICAAAGCTSVFVDESRNRSRRWCSDRCSGRINVAAFRSRKRAQATGPVAR